MAPSLELRHATREDWDQIAALIYQSTNHWYETNGQSAIFQGEPSSTLLFCEVYEALDPGRCLLVIDQSSGEIAGSCFYHPRETHVSLGIMNAHPDYLGQGVAKKLLNYIKNFAEEQQKPLRLVSSAMNLDSFSLYNRAGLTPYAIFQDMTLTVPQTGVTIDCPPGKKLRDATLSDVPGIVALEEELLGIRRERDFEYFVTNESGDWHTSIIENQLGQLDGFLVSIAHPGSSLLGPGCMKHDEDATALIQRELDTRRGHSMVSLIPSTRPQLVRSMYALGAKNCELHFAQSTETPPQLGGIMIPTFMPETA